MHLTGKLHGDPLASERPAWTDLSKYAQLREGDEDRPRDYNSAELNFEYVTDAAGMTDFMHAMSEADPEVIALDIETTGGLKPWMGTIRLIQIGIEEPTPRQWVVDCWETDPEQIFDWLEDESREIGTCNGQFEQLHLAYHYGVRLNNVFDICYAARPLHKRLYGKRRVSASFQALMRRYPQKKISKAQQTSKWDSPVLDRHQLRYAAGDVAGLLDIRRGLIADLHEHDLVEEAQLKTAKTIAKARESAELYGEQRRDESTRVLRAIKYAKSAEELELLREISRQLTLPHRARGDLDTRIATAIDRMRDPRLVAA